MVCECGSTTTIHQHASQTYRLSAVHTDHTNSPTVFTQISIVTERQRDGRNSSIICSPRYSSVAKSTFQYIYGYSRTYTGPLNTSYTLSLYCFRPYRIICFLSRVG